MTNQILRVACGFMEPDAFLQFINGTTAAATDSTSVESSTVGLAVALATAFFGGLATNLTPCVLPMIPVNVCIIGRTFRRGLVYALGQALVCGGLGLMAALGGFMLGSFHASRSFNGAVFLMMVVLGLSLLDVWKLDFSKLRNRLGLRTQALGLLGTFVLGGASAMLAGACVAPAVAVMMVSTMTGLAEGRMAYAALPFAFGLGLGFPWPFIAAGTARLPRPGAWMGWIKKIMGVGVILLGMNYGWRTIKPVPHGQLPSESANPSPNPVLYKVSAPWCTYCKKMDETTFRDPKVLTALERFDIRHLTIKSAQDLSRHPVLKNAKIVGVPAFVIASE